jgi:hypothetical protein
MNLGKPFCGLAVLLAGVYLLLAEDFAALEIVAAAGSGVLGALALRALLNTEPVRFSFSWRWSWGVFLLPYKIFRDSLLILWMLPALILHRSDRVGTFYEKLADSGDSPEAAANRALSVIDISMPPNTYVVEVDTGHNTQTIHRLVSSGPAPK